MADRDVKHQPRIPTEIDFALGARVREARARRSVSQIELAKQLGVTFQQIQKYEKGRNRISASRLVDISRALGVPLLFFYGTKNADFPLGGE